MGEAVGGSVGEAVGGSVGEAVGGSVGEAVGGAVGEAVGGAVGGSVGEETLNNTFQTDSTGLPVLLLHPPIVTPALVAPPTFRHDCCKIVSPVVPCDLLYGLG